MKLSDYTILELLEEIKIRNFDLELGEEKSKWLKENGYTRSGLDYIDFFHEGEQDPKLNVGYSFKFLLETNLEELKNVNKR